jgi:hypothetical protein
MKPYFPYFRNLNIQCWQHEGPSLGFHEPAICLQADAEACDIVLLAIDELIAESAPSERMLAVKPCRRRTACAKIRLIISPESSDLRQMSLSCGGDTAVFEFTPDGLNAFREAVAMWRNGSEDFSLHPETRRKANCGKKDLESGEVWFWTPFTDP